MSAGQSIQKHRKKLGLSQEELAQKLFVSRQTVSLWEKGLTSPTPDNLLRLKEIFGVSVDEILQGSEKGEGKKNTVSLCSVCAALCDAMGIPAPKNAAPPNPDLTYYAGKTLHSQKADRLVIFCPDAVGQWLYEKHPYFFGGIDSVTDLKLYLASEMPSVTPVNFGSLFSGAEPEVHGITKYEKKPVAAETIFDTAPRVGKKVALITTPTCSMGMIFPGRDIDYFYTTHSYESCAVAAKVILEDLHDIVVIYSGNYDAAQHKYGPESPEALSELKHNATAFRLFSSLVRDNWKHHNTLMAWCTDHGCHEIDGGLGSHGLCMVEDINVIHFFKGYPKEKEKQ